MSILKTIETEALYVFSSGQKLVDSVKIKVSPFVMQKIQEDIREMVTGQAFIPTSIPIDTDSVFVKYRSPFMELEFIQTENTTGYSFVE